MMMLLLLLMMMMMLLLLLLLLLLLMLMLLLLSLVRIADSRSKSPSAVPPFDFLAAFTRILTQPLFLWDFNPLHVTSAPSSTSRTGGGRACWSPSAAPR